MDEVNQTPKRIGAVVIAAVLIIGIYVVLSQNSQETASTTSNVVVTSQTADEQDDSTQPEATSQPADTATEQPAETPAPAAPTSTYADGQYSASLTYRVPDGHNEDITVALTLSGDTVSSLSVDTVATNNKSAEYQAGFDANIIGTVEGQDLDDADVSRLGGASLTSDAFNDILNAIRNDARV